MVPGRSLLPKIAGNFAQSVSQWSQILDKGGKELCRLFTSRSKSRLEETVRLAMDECTSHRGRLDCPKAHFVRQDSI